MKYELTISSQGYPMTGFEEDNLYEIIKLTDQAGRSLYKDGNRGLEVTWEAFPEKDGEFISSFVFPWEFIDD